jgi:hypothetical protein
VQGEGKEREILGQIPLPSLQSSTHNLSPPSCFGPQFQQGATELCRKYSPELQGRLDEFCKLVEDAKRSRVQNAAMAR